jgi:cytochrome c oxidase subunit III
VATTSARPAEISDKVKTAGRTAGTANLRQDLRIAVFPRTAALPAETGVWVAIAAISMCFAALISALIVRQGIAADWVHFAAPRILYFNTLILLLSSATLEAARGSFAKAQEPRQEKSSKASASRLERAHTWLLLTVALGVVFVVGQVIAWRDLVDNGLFLASSPSSSFFYLLTAAHGLHLLGGIAGLSYALWRIRRGGGSREQGVLSVAAVYWHFMDGLWVFLFVVLVART